MSHVDEGLLHAYADGAFASGDAQRAEIEAHLASCADCRARLEDARALTDRAREVLHHATPIDVQVPPFEEVRARSQDVSRIGAPVQRTARESGKAPRPVRSRARLAWAASIVLAVGAGWMANELIQRDTAEFQAVQDAAPVRRPERTSRPDVDAVDTPASPSEEAAEADGRERSTESDERRRSTADSSGERRDAAAPLAESGVDAEPQLAEVREGRAEAAAPIARTAEKLADRDAEREPMPAVADQPRRPATAQVRADRLAAVSPAVDALSVEVTRTSYRPSDVIALDAMPPVLADGRAFVGHVALLNDYIAAVGSGLWSAATAAQAAAALGRKPAGIEDLHLSETETAVVDGRVLVRQRYTLDGGAQLELIQRPTAAALPRARGVAIRERTAQEPTTAALPATGVAFENLSESGMAFRGESALAVSRPGLVLLLKGPLPQTTLHAIAARIE